MSSSRAVIRDLDVMESIVSNRNDLEWDGWDVIHYRPKAASFMNPRGAFRNGEWNLATRYPITEKGWIVPGRLFNVDR